MKRDYPARETTAVEFALFLAILGLAGLTVIGLGWALVALILRIVNR